MGKMRQPGGLLSIPQPYMQIYLVFHLPQVPAGVLSIPPAAHVPVGVLCIPKPHVCFLVYLVFPRHTCACRCTQYILSYTCPCQCPQYWQATHMPADVFSIATHVPASILSIGHPHMTLWVSLVLAIHTCACWCTEQCHTCAYWGTQYWPSTHVPAGVLSNATHVPTGVLSIGQPHVSAVYLGFPTHTCTQRNLYCSSYTLTIFTHASTLIEGSLTFWETYWQIHQIGPKQLFLTEKRFTHTDTLKWNYGQSFSCLSIFGHVL